MEILHDNVVVIKPNEPGPDYEHNNPLEKLLHLIEQLDLAAEREHYLAGSLNYLFPFESLELYGPTPWWEKDYYTRVDPRLQDAKGNLQQQNIKNFFASDTQLVRGWACAEKWIGPFLKLSYRGGPDSKLSGLVHHHLGDSIQLCLKINNGSEVFFEVPYNEQTDRYELELWGFNAPPARGDQNLEKLLRRYLGKKGQYYLDKKFIRVRSDLIQGSYNDFQRENLIPDQDIKNLHSENVMHPILPLRLQVAWGAFDQNGKIKWDKADLVRDEPYHYEFNMCVRGWDNFMKWGVSPRIHGGNNNIEYRTLFSNYLIKDELRAENKEIRDKPVEDAELRRNLEPWNFNAFDTKNHDSPLFDGPLIDPDDPTNLKRQRVENFMAVNFMDIDIFRPNCAIGLHRHRDNQEVYLMMEGNGIMVTGDWCKMPERERCLEVRTLRAGHLAKIRGGQLHSLLNPGDENIVVFIFGGYD